MKTDKDRHDEAATLTPEQARQGRIVLDTRRRQIVFLGSIVVFALLAVIGGLLWS